MKIVVIGGSGLIGSGVVRKLTEHGHEAVAASPSTGVDSITGEGLAEALAGASAVVDVSNAPSWDETAVLEFFTTSTRNLLAAEAVAGVGHHVALSVVGSERMTASGYFRAKVAQEALIEAGPVPASIVRATQFFEFLGSIAQTATDGDTVRLSPALIQPVAADDVSAAVARVAVGAPIGGMVEVGGPESFPLDELIRTVLAARDDPRHVVTDPSAPYFGWVPLEERTLVAGPDAIVGPTRFQDWLTATAPAS